MKDEGHIGGCESPPSGDAGVKGSGTGNSDRIGSGSADRPAPEVLSEDRVRLYREYLGDLADDGTRLVGLTLATSHEALRGRAEQARERDAVQQRLDETAVALDVGWEQLPEAAQEIVAERDRLLEAARAVITDSFCGADPAYGVEVARVAFNRLRALVEEHDGDG